MLYYPLIKGRELVMSSQGEGLVVKGNQKCGRNKSRSESSRNKSRSKLRRRKDIQCYKYGKKGHIKQRGFIKV